MGSGMERKEAKKTAVYIGSFPHIIFPHISQLTAYKLIKGAWGQLSVTRGYVNKVNENHIPSEILGTWL